jgi:hypothetical protein
MKILSAAPFDIEKCKSCQESTAARTSLFDDDAAVKKGDRCLNPECWTKKLQDHVRAKAKEFRAENPKGFIVDINDDGNDIFNYSDPIKANALDRWEIAKVKAGTKGAVPAFVVEGAQAGTTIWIKKPSDDSEGTGGTKPRGGKKTMTEKKKGLEKRRTIAFIGKVLLITEELKKKPDMFGKHKIEFVIELLSRFGADPLNVAGDYLDCKDGFETKTIGHDWQTILRCVIQEIEVALRGEMQEYEPERTNTIKVCDWLAIDEKKLLSEVEKEIPVPKAWGEQQKPAVRKCRVCGCTENNCKQCIKKTGKPCTWVEEDLCSACAPEKKNTRKVGRGLSQLINK